ncbi:uncharacterized protein LOC143547550 [Bidens hawaiensis]|uniref:uncharacterized protein LOC143547550 n=1 Tax=Bidens hawaiensis TaxID=980011 RepID=UPI004049FAF0
MKMKDSESIDDYSGRLSGLATKFAALGSAIDETRLVRNILTCMPKRFINIVASVEQMVDLKALKFEEIVGRLKAFEDRVNSVDDEPENNGKLLFNRAKAGKFKGKGKGESEKSRDDSKGDRNKEDEIVIGQVCFGDNSCVDIKGKGSITIICDDDVERIISNVYFIPNLTSSILSLGQETEHGCKVIMEDDQLLVLDKMKKVIMKSFRSRNRLYKVRLWVETPIRVETPMCLLSTTSVKKLDHQSTSMIYLSTKSGTKAYRINDLVRHQIHVS